MGLGFLFGTPGPLPVHAATAAWSPPALRSGADASFASPFDVVAGDPMMRTARKPTLAAISLHLEEQARHREDTPMVLTALQDQTHFGATTRHRYEDLATTSPLVAVFAVDLGDDKPAGVRLITHDASDPLASQWVVVTLGSHTAAALVARECPGPVPASEDERDFEFVVTHDRAVVTAVASTLLKRVR